MTTNSISAAMERTRKHIVQRRLKAQGVFMDGVVTADEMKRLRDDFNEAYYELFILRHMLRQQKGNMDKMSEAQRAELANQMNALKTTEMLVFKSFCHAAEALKKARTMRSQDQVVRSRDKTVKPERKVRNAASRGVSLSPRNALRRLRIRLTPEEMALLSGCVLHALEPRRSRDARMDVERNLLRVARMIRNGERRKDVLMAALREGRTR